MQSENFTHIKFRQTIHGVVKSDWYEMSRLGQSVHNYPNCIMFSLGEGKTGYEIHVNVILLPLGNWNGIQ